MSLILIKRLDRLDQIIRFKATGSPRHLAKRLNLSERTIRQYIQILKELGAPVKYCRQRNTYFYEEEGTFYFSFRK